MSTKKVKYFNLVYFCKISIFKSTTYRDMDMRFLLLLAILCASPAVSEQAVFGEELKSRYSSSGSIYKNRYLVDIGENSFAYSFTCNMGEAIKDEAREDWYTNRPVDGLKLELRARAIIRHDLRGDMALGFVAIRKHADDLKIFKPDINYAFSIWDINNTYLTISGARLEGESSIYFDLLDGKGFYYRNLNSDDPDYFLSKCKRIKKEGLPVYEYLYEGLDSVFQQKGLESK